MDGRFIKVDLSGKVVLVTGSSRGIGKAIAAAFAEQGAKVIVVGRHLDVAQETVQEIGPLAIAIKADVTSEDQVKKMYAEIEKQAGGTVDILVNNAGAQIALLTVEDMTLDVWEKAVALNLTGVMLCSKYAIPAMKEQGWGRIINVSSISGRSGGGPGGSSYASAKGGVTALTKALAKEVGPFGTTANSIEPGVVMTRIHEKFSTKESLENLEKITPLGRLGQPVDIAGTAIFLASDSAAFINGEAIAVNGGLRME